jgi:spermidine/putrescine transport system substrate-binding protein
MIAAVAVGVVLTACSSDSGSSGPTAAGSPSRAAQETGPVTLKVLAFNDYMPEDIPKQFKELTGNDMEITYTSSNEDAIAKIQAAGPGAYDIAWITSPFTQGLIAAGGLEQLDAAAIPNVANLYPEASQLDYDPGNQYSIPYSWGTTGICYRKDLVKNTTIDSWDNLLHPSSELAGKVTLIDEDRWILEPALKMLGFSLNTTNPDELQQAADMTIEAKDTLLGFDGETFYAKLVSGEALAVQGWDGWCNYGTAEDPNVVYVQPKEGSDLWVDTMVIPKGSTHVQQAEDFINFILEPENQQWVAENILYKVPNQKSMEALDPAFLDQFPNMKMTPQEILGMEALHDLGDGATVFSDAVTQVKSG